MQKNIAIIALGSNLGDRSKNLKNAINGLENKLKIRSCSNIYRSTALLPKDAPKDWDKDFYNCVLVAETHLSPRELLDFCFEVENFIHKKEKGQWSPRYIDIDILAYNNDVIDSEDLKIPHPQMLNRDFVVIPLNDILPDWQHPVTKMRISDVAKTFDKSSIEKLDIKLI